jgi:exodeoxyribonuclease VII large subunit
VPVRSELLGRLDQLVHRARHCLARKADRARERLELTVCRWPRPDALFAAAAQRSDELAARLPRALGARAGHARADLNAVAPRLRHQLLLERVSRGGDRLASLWRLAELAHPDRPLKRGFVRVTDRSGRTLAKAADARAERLLTLHFGDGKVDAATDGAPAGKRLERGRGRPYLPPQPGLFDEAEE